MGIVGKNPGNLNNMQILSNSSSHARFERNHTLKSWMARYSTKLHLDVAFFELKRNQF